jgi:DNA repair protein RecN (Recombination protein N)
MLVKLVVENLALIDHLELDFPRGLIVLSGETGAGKSLILDALSLILGDRATTELVRTGAQRAVVQAVFEDVQLPGDYAQFVDEGQLIISREVQQNGRSVARVNGQIVTVGILRALGAALVDLHGQHEHQSLLRVDKHREVLDRFGGEPVANLLGRLGELTDQFAGVSQQLEQIYGDARERERRLDMLRFQTEEIAAARLQPGEEETLLNERRALANYERLYGSISRAYALLSQGTGHVPSALEQLSEAVGELDDARRFDQRLGKWQENLQAALYTLEEGALTLRNYLEELEHDPNRLDRVEQRLDQISGLKRKYGDSIEQILHYQQQAAQEIDRIENNAELAERLSAQLEMIMARYEQTAAQLTALRQRLAEELALQLQQQLADLGMSSAQFQVAIGQQLAQKPSRVGWDLVEFMFSANPGEPPRPLVRVISGGEMSRVMLALKTLLAEHDSVDTLIFDEIDDGISGKAALVVADKLQQLAQSHQVICISHLASIASCANYHLLISKDVVDGATYTRVEALQGEARVREIARLLDGESSPIGYAHARELLQSSGQLRETSDNC